MKSLTAFFNAHPWVGHIPCALVFMLLVGAPLRAAHVLSWAWIAAGIVAGLFWGWKAVEYQVKAGVKASPGVAAPHAAQWWRGYTPVEWALRADTRPYVLQWVAPTATAVGAALTMARLGWS